MLAAEMSIPILLFFLDNFGVAEFPESGYGTNH